MNLPNHIVLIPDGNRRWAQKRNLPSFLGHQKGAENTQKILRFLLDLKIKYFTFWGSSLDNIRKRPREEVYFLFKLFEEYFNKLKKDKRIYKNKVKINVFGRWRELFPVKLKKVIQETVKSTKDNDNFYLTILLAYSGLDEMKMAVNKIANLKLKNPNLEIDEKVIKKNLWTKDLPAVDLVIRTGGEPHWSSGLMMWEIADAQFYFTETLYPDFSLEELKEALGKYIQTQRRFGA